MERTAVIDGREYRFMEELPSLGEPSSFVLCANPDGRQYICPKDFWPRHAAAVTPDPSAPIHAKSTPQEKTALFLSLFRGRENLYARRYYNLKTGKSGYVPACQNEWKPGICDKKGAQVPRLPQQGLPALDRKRYPGTPLGKGRVLPGCGWDLSHAGGWPNLAFGG